MATATKAKPSTKLQPLEDRVVILPAEEAESMRGGLYIPDTAKEKPNQGEIIAVGPGRFEKGTRVADGRQGRRPGALREVQRHPVHASTARSTSSSRSPTSSPRSAEFGSHLPRRNDRWQRRNCISTPTRARRSSAASTLAEAVKVTLGPKGRNVVIDKKFGSPTVTKDGVTVAKEIELSDPIENMGAQMVKEVATKTSDLAGDGTTTATVLAQAIFREGLKNVTAGANPMELKRGIDKAVEAVVEELKKIVGPDRRQEGDRAGRHHLREQRQGDRQPDRRGDGEGRQGRRHHGRGGQGPRDRRSRRSTACSSTAATSRRTSSPIRRRWKRCSRTPTS